MERRRLYTSMLAELLDTGVVARDARVLVSCAGPEDQRMLSAAGLHDVTLTGIRDGTNAEQLPFPDLSFDLAVVSAGLHHCRQPHRALLELVRVAPVAIAIEARDTILIRALTRARLLEEHEHSAVRDGGRDGLEGTSTANYVFRWTEREIRKTVASYLPGEETRIVFRHDVDFHGRRSCKAPARPGCYAWSRRRGFSPACCRRRRTCSASWSSVSRGSGRAWRPCRRQRRS